MTSNVNIDIEGPELSSDWVMDVTSISKERSNKFSYLLIPLFVFVPPEAVDTDEESGVFWN